MCRVRGRAGGALMALAIVLSVAGCGGGDDAASSSRTAEPQRKPSRTVPSTTTTVPPPTTVVTEPPVEEPPPVEAAPEPVPAPARVPEPEPSRGAVLVAGTSEVVFTPSEGTPGTVGAIIFVTNVGDAETAISVWGSGGRASVRSNCSGVLPAGERCQVTVSVYGPGPVNGTVFVGTPDGVVLQIPITGEV